jgi:VanZ family protein
VVGLYAALILFVGSRPRLHSPITFPMWDKVAHVGEYGLLGLLGYTALASRDRRGLWRPALVLVLGLAWGGLDEWIQAHTPGRESTFTDWLADAAGILIGIGVGAYLGSRRAAGGEEAGG